MASLSPDRPIVVLFVDDDPALLRSIARVLSQSPLRVLTADRPDMALEILRDGSIDVLVSDIEMPEMDGLELVRRVRQDQPSVLRMLLTASATLERALNAINEGEVVRFFTKPFDVEVFRNAMETLANRIRRARREERDAAAFSRRAELQRWLEGQYPGLLEVVRSNTGEIVVDVVELIAFAERSGNAQAIELARTARPEKHGAKGLLHLTGSQPTPPGSTPGGSRGQSSKP